MKKKRLCISRLLFVLLFFCIGFFTVPVFAAEEKSAEPAEKMDPSGKDTEPSAQTADPDKKVAEVNGVIITQAELDREIDNLLRKGQMNQTQPVSEDFKQKALDNLIKKELIYQAAKKSGVKVDEAEVEKQFEQVKGRFPSDDAFKEILENQNMTKEQVKDEIRQALVIRSYIENEFMEQIEVTEEMKKEYYSGNKEKFKQPERVKASHILVKVPPDADEKTRKEAREKIEKIQEEIKAGEDFTKLAQEKSEGPSSEKGGDLGFFMRGQMVKPFEEAAFSLKEGEVSQIVETQFGYHIIKVSEKESEKTMSYEEMAPRIEQFLKQEKMMKMVQDKLEQMRENVDIKVYI